MGIEMLSNAHRKVGYKNCICLFPKRPEASVFFIQYEKVCKMLSASLFLGLSDNAIFSSCSMPDLGLLTGRNLKKGWITKTGIGQKQIHGHSLFGVPSVTDVFGKIIAQIEMSIFIRHQTNQLRDRV